MKYLLHATAFGLIGTTVAHALWHGLVQLMLLQGPSRRRASSSGVLSRLSALGREEFVRQGREATLFDIRWSVRQADPVMPGDPVQDLDLEFFDRAN